MCEAFFFFCQIREVLTLALTLTLTLTLILTLILTLTRTLILTLTRILTLTLGGPTPDATRKEQIEP